MLHLHRLASYRKFSDGSEPALNPQVAREDAMASWARGRVAVARGVLMLTACHFKSSKFNNLAYLRHTISRSLFLVFPPMTILEHACGH